MLRRILLINVLIITTLIVVSGNAFEIEQIEPEIIENIDDKSDDNIDEIDSIDDINNINNINTSTDIDTTGQNQSQPPSQPQVQRPATRADLGRMSREELFQLAFGRGAPVRPRNIVLNLIVEGIPLGVAEVVYSADFASFDFISPRLSALLDTIIISETRAAAGDSVGYFNSAVLRGAGYRLQVVDGTHELYILVPPGEKALMRTNLRGGFAWAPHGEAVGPAFFSFYTTYRLSGSFTSRSGSYDLGGREFDRDDFVRAPLAMSLDGAAAMLGWVLEGTASLREPAQGEPVSWDLYRRGDVRLVREVVPWSSRFTAGDIGLVMGGGTVGGVRYEYNRNFFGNSVRDEESGVEFFMPRAGYVEVFIDEVYRQSFFLPAGRHYVSGFGGETGRNSARLVLRMADGSMEEVPFEYILGHARNVGRGASRLTVAAGVKRVSAPSPACFEYVFEEPAVSFDYTYGFTRRISGGLGGISSLYNNVGRLQASIDLGRLGWMSVSGGGNYAPEAEFPTGYRLDASYTPDLRLSIRRLNRMTGGDVYGRGWLPQVGVSARGYYQSFAYNASPFDGAGAGAGAERAGVSGSAGFGLWRGGISFGAGLNYTGETAGDTGVYYPISYNYNARLSQTVMRVPVSATAGVNVSRRVRRPYFSMNLSHAFGTGAGLGGSIGRHQLSAAANIGTGMAYTPLVVRHSIDPETGESHYEIVPDDRGVGISMGASAGFGWRWANRNSGINSQQYSANVSVPNLFNPAIPGLNANLTHRYNRAILTANYRLVRQSTDFMEMRDQYLNASLAGSFMFADGLWAFGQPTGGSFLLADARHNLKGANVHIDRSPHGRYELSRNGWLGAAYKGMISPYTQTAAIMTLTDAPPGAVMQNNRFYTTGAGYKRGYALRLGTKAGVLAQARFTSMGRPLSYVYLTVGPEGGREEERRATFTGGDGALQMSGFEEGKTYRVRFARAANIKDVLFTVPKDAGLLFDMGVMEVDRAAAE